MQDLDPEAKYTYQGMEEDDSTDHQKMKNKIQKNMRQESSLYFSQNSMPEKNICNQLEVPIVMHNYSVIDWKLDDVQDLDRIIRKQLCMNDAS